MLRFTASGANAIICSVHVTSGVDKNGGAYTFSQFGKDHYESALVPGYTVGLDNTTNTMGQRGFAAIQHLQQFADITNKSDSQLIDRARQIAESIGETEQDTIDKIMELSEEHSEN